MKEFEFLFNSDIALYLAFTSGVIIGWFIIACMNGIDAIIRCIEEYKINKKIKKLEALKKEIEKNENNQS